MTSATLAHLVEEVCLKAEARCEAAEELLRHPMAVRHEGLCGALEAGRILLAGPEALHADHAQLAASETRRRVSSTRSCLHRCCAPLWWACSTIIRSCGAVGCMHTAVRSRRS